MAEQLLTTAMADHDDLRRISEAWREWAAHPDGWLAILHGEILCRVPAEASGSGMRS